MRQLHSAMVIGLIAASLLAALTILVPAVAEAAPAAPARSGHAPPDTSPTGAGSHRVRAAPQAEPDLPAASPQAAGVDTARPSAARRSSGPAQGPWKSPVDGLDPLTGFDPPPLPWMPGHRGVDLAAADDQAVAAAGAGTVVFAGDLAGRGVVSIAHANGLRTTYEPVTPLVTAGEAVAAGQTVGRLQPGHASCAGTVCLHLGLKRGPLYLDPMLLFGAGKVRLLPRPGHAAASSEHLAASSTPPQIGTAPRRSPLAGHRDESGRATARSGDRTEARP